MTPTRTYKIIEHFKSGKMVCCQYARHLHTDNWYEIIELKSLINELSYAMGSRLTTFRLINKKGRRG